MGVIIQMCDPPQNSYTVDLYNIITLTFLGNILFVHIPTTSIYGILLYRIFHHMTLLFYLYFIGDGCLLSYDTAFSVL